MKNFTLLCVCLICQIIDCRELKFVQAIWRHGDRAPSKLSYPNNPYNESYWPRGWDQLTNVGMQQLYELGQFFKLRYSKIFVNQKYDADEVYARSSTVDRALNSAQAMLYGFFPAIDDEHWNNNINWQPIPIHADAPDDQDPLLKPTSFDCPAYDKAYKKNSKFFIENITLTYANLFQYLGNVTGFGPNITFDEVTYLANINREIAHNLTQPDWVYKTWPEFSNKTTLEIITELNAAYTILEFNTKKLYYLRGGFVMGDFLKRALAVASGAQKKPSKMVLYSAHDGTLLPLIYAMQVADNQTIPYAACVIMEIWQNNGSYEVDLFYRKNGNLTNLIVPGCIQTCPIDRFYHLLKEYAIFDEKKLYKKCGLEYCDAGVIRPKNAKHKNSKKSSKEKFSKSKEE